MTTNPISRPHSIEKRRIRRYAWSRDPERVAFAYTVDSRWRNRAEFISGREEILRFLQRKWAHDIPSLP